MKKTMMAGLVLMLLLAGCAGSAKTGIEIAEAWARAGVSGDNSAVYFKITNHDADNAQMISAMSDLAQKTELHRSTMGSDGTMMMMHQESISLPAGETVEFKPGDYHIMLIGLTRDLNVGDTIHLVLKLEGGREIDIEAVVK